ncbi:fibronectin type III domain-containing protein [Nocardioides caricicola]|uniref:Fibronectin type III domain-containing protein n=1 Tax=Nocardioides caricicola TaxID=634770 RepID=A0ABW0N178_9ACTN
MRIATAVLGALVLVAGIPGSASAAPQPQPEPQPIPAVQADSVVDGYGVGIHLNFLNTPYRDEDAVAALLRDLGVRHVRDDLYLDAPWQYDAIETVAEDAGVRFDLIMGRPGTGAVPADYVATVAEQFSPGVVESIEGVNEWDLFGGEEWVTEMRTWQEGLWAAAGANPATADLPVLSPALAFRWNYAEVGDLSPFADVANAHMYPGGHKPSNQVTRITEALKQAVPGRPVVTTEAGYHNAMAAESTHPPVPEDVAGVYLPRLLLEHLGRGEQRMYSYELIDSFDDPAQTNPEAHFGLVRHDLTPKPAYSSMKALLALLADPGPAFQPGSLAVAADGLPEDARYLLTQKRNGDFVLLLFRDVSLWDPDAQAYLPERTADVTLRFAEPAELTVNRPSDRGHVPSTTRGASLPIQLDGQVTAVTVDTSIAPSAPSIVSAKPGKRRVTVRWEPPAGSVTAYRLTALGRTVTVGPGRTQATLTRLPAGKRLRVAVRAQNEHGWSAPAYTRYLKVSG